MTIAPASARRLIQFRASGKVALLDLLVGFAVATLVGWFAFVAFDSARGIMPEQIRISADGEYDPYLDDFVVFYAAGRLALNGEGATVFDIDAIHEAQAMALDVTPEGIIRLPYFNPPPFLMALAPVALLPLVAAAALWTAFQVMLAIGAVAILARARLVQVRRRGVGIALLAFAASMPVHEVILHGQISFLLLAGWALFLAGMQRQRAALFGVGLALIAVKPQLAVIPAAYLLLTKEWRATGLAAGLWAVGFGLAGALYGPRAVIQWVDLLAQALHWDDENGIWVHAMFGWNAFARGLLGPEHLETRAVMSAGLSLVTLAAAALLWRRRSRPVGAWRASALLIYPSLLVSPHLFAQDLVLAALPVLLALSLAPPAERALWVGFGLTGWTLSFLHFPALIGSPEDFGVNLVTLWMASGVLLAGWNTQCWFRRHVARVVRRVPNSPRPGWARPLEYGLSAAIAAILFATVSGFAETRYAEAITYSYTADNGETYRFPLANLAFDGP